jgi:hypothetical protein
MRKFKYIQAILSSVLLSGCAFSPTPGMSFKDVNSEAGIMCTDSRTQKTNEHLRKIGIFRNTPDLIAYTTIASRSDRMTLPECLVTFHFYKDLFVTESKANELADNYDKQIKADLATKINGLQSEIDSKKLVLLKDFANKNAEDFRIYVDTNGNKYYSKNYKIISESDAFTDIGRYLEEKALIAKYTQQRKLDEEKIIQDKKIKEENERLVKIQHEKSKQEFNERRKSIDLISKVLNYSSGWGDDGSASNYWAKIDNSQCTYRNFKNPDNSLNAAISGMLDKIGANQAPNEINFNNIDPRSIRFTYEEIIFFNKPTKFTIIKANDRVLFRTNGELDILRLNNGWGKMFNGSCKGRRRDF